MLWLAESNVNFLSLPCIIPNGKLKVREEIIGVAESATQVLLTWGMARLFSWALSPVTAILVFTLI
jgi:hypothetical protein